MPWGLPDCVWHPQGVECTHQGLEVLNCFTPPLSSAQIQDGWEE